jgi:hypothetical protein
MIFVVRRAFGRIKYHKDTHLGAVPYYLKPHFIDPHDYPLRSKVEVMTEWA